MWKVRGNRRPLGVVVDQLNAILDMVVGWSALSRSQAAVALLNQRRVDFAVAVFGGVILAVGP